MSLIADQNYPYRPGVVFDATKGFNRFQFESILHKAIPYGELERVKKDPTYPHQCVTVTNFTGSMITAVVTSAKMLDDNCPDSRENHREYGSANLPNGCTTAFQLPPYNMLVSVSQFQEGGKGRRRIISKEGFLLHQIRNKTITFNEGSANGLVDDTISTMNLGHYCYFKNNTDNILKIEVVVLPPPPDDAATKQELVSRMPDFGADPIECKHVAPGATLHFLPPDRMFWVYCIESNEEEQYGVDGIMGLDQFIPPATNYVEETKAKCSIGSHVAFLQSTDRNGSIDPYVSKWSEVKAVDSSIVRDCTGTGSH